MLQKDDLIELANTGSQGEGYGLAAHRKGVENTLTSDFYTQSVPLPVHLSKNKRAVCIKKQLSREMIDGSGKLVKKSLFTISSDDLQRMKNIETVNFVDYLPKSIKRKYF